MRRALISKTPHDFQALTTRFAPSPNGLLHIGHVAHVLYVWGLAKKFDAKIIFRSEDHDDQRCNASLASKIVDDMYWLGLEVDGGLEKKKIIDDYRQSTSRVYYDEALAKLEKLDLLYRCYCTRKNLRNRLVASGLDISKLQELPYDGYCRNKRTRSSDQAKTDFALRLKIPPKYWTEFYDINLGFYRQNPAKQCGDMILLDRRGQPSYNFAVVVDDIRHGVNLIIRGQDLTETTGRQLFLRSLLTTDKSAINYYHHPLILDEAGKKLAKRFGATSLASLRAQGYSPEAVTGLAAYLVGLQTSPKSLKITDAPGLLNTTQPLK